MAVDSYNATTGRPVFTDTGAPDIAVDDTAVGIYAADGGNRIVRDNLAGLDAYGYKRAGLAGHAKDTRTDYVHNGSGWVPVSTVLEATASPLLTNGVSAAITGWTIDAAASSSPDEVATISGSTITVKPGKYVITVLISLNSSGAPRPVTGRSFVEVTAGETTLQPRPRNNPAVGEDSWSLSFSRRYAAATAITVNALPSTSVSPVGSQLRLMIVRVP